MAAAALTPAAAAATGAAFASPPPLLLRCAPAGRRRCGGVLPPDTLRLIYAKRRSHKLASTVCSAAAAAADSGGGNSDILGGSSESITSATTAATVASDAGEQLRGYLAMARLVNYAPSATLVFLGAWLSCRNLMAVFANASVWVVAGLSAMITCAANILNDYFDYRSGADGVNSPTKPLVRGTVGAEGALLTSATAFALTLFATSWLELRAARLLVSTAAMVTYVYTPLLKRIPLLKNAAVGTTVACAILAGGLVAGGPGSLSRLSLPCSFTFLTIMFREVLMDLNDVEGDRASGVRTLPVLLGREGGLLAAVAMLAIATVMVATYGPPTVAFSACMAAALVPLYASAVEIYQKGFPSDVLSKAVSSSMLPISFGLLVGFGVFS